MKLKPEQIKLWRKTFHQERDRGVEPKIAAERADEAVKVWDERGAFDDDVSINVPRDIALHWHARIRVIASVDGAATIFAGDEIRLGDDSVARVTTNETARGGAIDFDMIGQGTRPDVGSQIRLVLPRLGVAAEGIVLA